MQTSVSGVGKPSFCLLEWKSNQVLTLRSHRMYPMKFLLLGQRYEMPALWLGHIKL